MERRLRRKGRKGREGCWVGWWREEGKGGGRVEKLGKDGGYGKRQRGRGGKIIGRDGRERVRKTEKLKGKNSRLGREWINGETDIREGKRT